MGRSQGETARQRPIVIWIAALGSVARPCSFRSQVKRGNGLSERKIAIVLQAGSDTHEGMARALHALIYAKELTEAGVETRLIFDGAGSEWAAKLLAPESPQEKGLAAMLSGITGQGVVYEICDYCSGAFHVKDKLQAANAPLSGQYMNHPSIASLVLDGFQILIL